MFKKIIAVSTMLPMLLVVSVAPVLAKGTTVVKPLVSQSMTKTTVKRTVVKPTVKPSVKPVAPKTKIKGY